MEINRFRREKTRALKLNSAPVTGAVSRTYRVITDMLNREKCGTEHTV